MLIRSLPVLLLIIHLPLTDADPVSPSAAEQALNFVSVEIEETAISIDISFNGSFEGELHCSATLLLNLGIFVESVDVFLDVNFPPEISIALTDYEFTLTPEDPTFQFLANVTVNPGTSSSERPVITIDGTANAQPSGTKGGIAEDSATVIVLPFYTAEIAFKEGSGSIERTKSKTFQLLIENRGNAGETYILNWANRDELKGKDISIDFEEKDVFLQEGEKKEIDVTIKTGDRTTRGSYIVRIEVWSEINGPDSKEESNAVIVVDVSDPYLGTIQGFFSKSPYMIYLTGAAVLIAIVLLVYFLLRWRAKRAWRRRLREYQLYGEEEGQEMVSDPSVDP